MPCYDPEIRQLSEIEYLSNMLCNACKNLSVEQMKIIIGDTYRDNLWIWYKNHLITDLLESLKNNNILSYLNTKEEAARLDMIFCRNDGRIYSLEQIFGNQIAPLIKTEIYLIPKLQCSEGWVPI